MIDLPCEATAAAQTRTNPIMGKAKPFHTEYAVKAFANHASIQTEASDKALKAVMDRALYFATRSSCTCRIVLLACSSFLY